MKFIDNFAELQNDFSLRMTDNFAELQNDFSLRMTITKFFRTAMYGTTIYIFKDFRSGLLRDKSQLNLRTTHQPVYI